MRTLLRSAIVLVLLAAGGCAGTGAPTSTYSYDPRFNFAEWKAYRWGAAKPLSVRDPLLEANVRFLVERELQAKGLTQQWEKATLVVGVDYKSGPKEYELKELTLNFTLPEGRELVWRGLATGPIKTDAASGELQKVVAGLLANFPPKK